MTLKIGNICFIVFLMTTVAFTETRKMRLSSYPVKHEYKETNNRNITATSNLRCAIACAQFSCTEIEFDGEICTLKGVGSFSEVGEVGNPLRGSIFRNLVNVALLKQTYASSQYGDRRSSYVVDENNCRDDQYCGLLTYSTTNPFFLVDLGSPKKIYVVDVGPCQARGFGPIKVFVGQTLVTTGDFTSYTELQGNTNQYTFYRHLFSLPEPVIGQYVSVQRIVTSNFWLCDVEVLAEEE